MPTEKRSNEQLYYDTLRRIARQYQTYEQMQKDHEDYGLSYVEELEMAYENIQTEASGAIYKRRRPEK